MRLFAAVFFFAFLALLCTTGSSLATGESRQLKSEYWFRRTHYNEWIHDYGKPIVKPIKFEVETQIKYQIKVDAITTDEGEAIMIILRRYPRKIPAHLADLMREALERPAPKEGKMETWIKEYGKPIKNPVRSEIEAALIVQVNAGTLTEKEKKRIMHILDKFPKTIPAYHSDLIREALERPSPESEEEKKEAE